MLVQVANAWQLLLGPTIPFAQHAIEMVEGWLTSDYRCRPEQTFARDIALDESCETLELATLRNGHPLGNSWGKHHDNDTIQQHSFTQEHHALYTCAHDYSLRSHHAYQTQIGTHTRHTCEPVGQSAEHAWQAGFCLQYTSQRFRARAALAKLQQHHGVGLKCNVVCTADTILSRIRTSS